MSTHVDGERIMLREFSTRMYGESYVSERNRLVVFVAVIVWLAKDLCGVGLVFTCVVKVMLGKGSGLVLDVISNCIDGERTMLHRFSS